MLVIEVELLTGRYAASSFNDRDSAEWPPHPARFFSALVAALHDRDPVADGQRAALLWLEQQPPPSLRVDLEADCGIAYRDVHPVFVPVNDITVHKDVDEGATQAPNKRTTATQSDMKAAIAILPNRRTRQARTFPVAIPREPRFAFIWPCAPELPIRTSLEALCARVTRLGHSSSFVHCRVADQPAVPTLVPCEQGDTVLRVVSTGQLDRLERAFQHHQAQEHRILPAVPQPYAKPASKLIDRPAAATTIFSDDWIVYQRREGARLRSSSGNDLGRALRAALIEANASHGPLAEAICGHDDAQRPSRKPHLAFVACPDVGHTFADGAILGCAIVLPRGLTAADRRQLMLLIGRWERERGIDGRIELGGNFRSIQMERVAFPDRRTLQPARWCRPSHVFITATPIALDRHPGNLRSNHDSTAHKAAISAQDTIADACERIGLPRPIEVEISSAPWLEGAQPVHDFARWPAKQGQVARALTHARVRFAQQVQGPLLLGAGRFFGLGLCLPISSDGAFP